MWELRELGAADEDGETAAGGPEAEGQVKSLGEVLNGAKGDDIGRSHAILAGARCKGRLRGNFRAIGGRNTMILSVRLHDAVDNSFGTFGDYIDVCQCKCAGDFSEECGLFVIGLDEGQVNFRLPDFYGEARETGAGPEIDY